MGGYGATRIGMKHADVFGSLYIMSPCCLAPRSRGAGERGGRKGAGRRQDSRGLGQAAVLGCAPSWRPPRPGRRIRRIRRCTSTCRPRMASRSPKCWRSGRRTRRWHSSISTSAICAAIAAIAHRRRRPGRPAGRHGQAARRADSVTASSNTFEIYPGTHTSAWRSASRNVMPFFAKHLCFEAKCRR